MIPRSAYGAFLHLGTEVCLIASDYRYDLLNVLPDDLFQHNGTDFAAGILGIPLIEQRLFGKGKDKQAEIQYSCGFAAGWLPKS